MWISRKSLSCETRNHPKIIPATYRVAKLPTNQPQTSQYEQKTSFPCLYVTKNFRDSAKYTTIILTFSSKDQGLVGIEAKWREIF